MSGGEKVGTNRYDIRCGVCAHLRAPYAVQAVAYASENLRKCLRAGLRGPLFAPRYSSSLRAGYGPKQIRN